jgi:hypothetical protein
VLYAASRSPLLFVPAIVRLDASRRPIGNDDETMTTLLYSRNAAGVEGGESTPAENSGGTTLQADFCNLYRRSAVSRERAQDQNLETLESAIFRAQASTGQPQPYPRGL